MSPLAGFPRTERPMTRPTRLRSLASTALTLLITLAGAATVYAQLPGEALATQNLRPYQHVFIAYAVAWLLIFGWLVWVGRRLARLERSLKE